MKDKMNAVLRKKDSSDFYEALQRAGCVICGTIGCGKSNLAKHIATKLIEDSKDKNVKIRIFDVVGNWFYEFKAVPSQIIKRSNEIRISPKVVVYYLKMETEAERREFIKTVLKRDFETQRKLYDDAKGDLSKIPRIYNIIEEANTILSTYSIKQGFFRDFVAFSRNYNIRNVYIMQRLADSSTKVIERVPNLAIGRTVGANDLRRIKAIIPKEKLLGVDFGKPFVFQLYFDCQLIKFYKCKFKGELTDEYFVMAKTRGIFRRRKEYRVVKLKDFAIALEKAKDVPKQVYFDEPKDDLDEEMELDLALLGEPDEEW